MGRYGLLTTYSNTLCNKRGERFVCNSFGDANRLRLSIDADCDAYEQRIAELTAELARVKAESLRVVEVENREISPLEAIFRHSDCVVRDTKGKFYQLSRGATQFPDGLSARAGVFVVRLERWEDGE